MESDPSQISLKQRMSNRNDIMVRYMWAGGSSYRKDWVFEDQPYFTTHFAYYPFYGPATNLPRPRKPEMKEEPRFPSDECKDHIMKYMSNLGINSEGSTKDEKFYHVLDSYRKHGWIL